jgi:hypothetical protein
MNESPTPQVEVNDKERNFRQLEAKYQRELEKARNANVELERQMQQVQAKIQPQHEEEETDDPYVDHKRLNRTLTSFEKRMEEKIEKMAETKASQMMEQKSVQDWLKRNPDFQTVMDNHANKLWDVDPELADSILTMPDNFERQKIVYRNVKSLGLDKPAQKAPSIQDKIDANRRSPYYQPTGIASTPYQSQGDFSQAGQANAYKKMQEMKARLGG